MKLSVAEIPSETGGDEVGRRAAHFFDTSVLVPPGWRRRAYRCVQPALENLLGFHEIRRHYRELVEIPMDGAVLAQRVLDALEVVWEMPETEKNQLRETRRSLVVVANHPFGGLDFFALSLLLEEVWPGSWKFLGNQAMGSIPGFDTKLIPMDPLGVTPQTRRLNRTALRTALTHVRDGGILGLFPAGRVSHRHSKLGGAVADRDWSGHAVKLARASGAGLICLHVAGQNSGRFLRVPTQWVRLRSLCLCRELIVPPVSTVGIRLAETYTHDALSRLGEPGVATRKVRADCYALADRVKNRTGSISVAPSTAPEGGEPTIDIAGPDIAALVKGLSCVTRAGSFDLLLMRGNENLQVLGSLGRLREQTFRLAGQGTGKAIDLSVEDSYYWHLLLWDSENGRLAGAYRIGVVDEVLREYGMRGLYLAKVFHIQPGFFKKIGRSVELSRSFIAPPYQRSAGALAALWKGLGAVVQQEGIETLFGSVTISNAYHSASRAIMVEFLRQNHADDPDRRRLVKARQPFHPTSRYHRLVATAYAGETLEKLDPLILRMEGGARGVPVLMRYYQSLGARYLDFHIERDFQDALYCLLRVEVASIPGCFRRRFIKQDPTAVASQSRQAGRGP